MMYFKQQSTDEEVDPLEFVGFAQDNEGTLWYFSELFKPFTRFDGTITMGNE